MNELKKNELNEQEMENVTGGGFWDIVNVEDRVKMSNGDVCPKCGHAVGTIKYSGTYPAFYAILCERCGERIGFAATSADVVKV